MGRRSARAAAAFVFLLLAGGCELAEVATPGGEDLLVVEGILRAGEVRQRVLLHRSLDGAVVRGEPGARVTVREEGGPEVVLEERRQQVCADRIFPGDVDSLTIDVSCFETLDLDVVPGRTYELRVETLDGRVVRGRTTVPGDFRFRAPPPPADGAHVCSLDPYTQLPLAWSMSAGAWSYLIAIEIVGLRQALEPLGIPAPERLELTGVAVSQSDTTLVVPAEIGLFERADVDQRILRVLQDGFPPGVGARLVVLAADRNFVNGVRGGSFNPSGSVRISSVVGDGVGVFGSAVPLDLALVVGVEPRYPGCG